MIILAILFVLFLMWGFVRIMRDPLPMIDKGDNLFNYVAPTQHRPKKDSWDRSYMSISEISYHLRNDDNV